MRRLQIFRNIGINQPDLAATRVGIRLGDRGLASTQRFYLAAGERDAGLEDLANGVVEARLAVIGDNLEASGSGLLSTAAIDQKRASRSTAPGAQNGEIALHARRSGPTRSLPNTRPGPRSASGEAPCRTGHIPPIIACLTALLRIGRLEPGCPEELSGRPRQGHRRRHLRWLPRYQPFARATRRPAGTCSST